MLCFWNGKTQNVALKWALHLKCDSGDVFSSAITIDEDNNTYFEVAFRDDSLIIDSHSYISPHRNGQIVTKYNSDGKRVWVKEENEISYRASLGIRTLLAHGENLLIPFVFYDTTCWGGDTIIPRGYRDGFVDYVDKNGKTLWSLQLEGYMNLWDVRSFSNGDFIIMGEFLDSLRVFDKSVYGTCKAKGEWDYFFLRIDPKGNKIWQKVISKCGNVYLPEMIIDKEDNIYFAAYYSGKVEFEDRNIENPTASNRYLNFLAKFDEHGKINWVTSFGSSNGNNSVQGLEVSSNNEIRLLNLNKGNPYNLSGQWISKGSSILGFDENGKFRGEIVSLGIASCLAINKYDELIVDQTLSASPQNYLFSKYRANSENVFIEKAKSNYFGTTHQVKVNRQNFIALEGTFTGPLELNSEYKFNNTGLGSNAFIALYEDLTATNIISTADEKNPVSVYPNPTRDKINISFSLEQPESIGFRLIDARGVEYWQKQNVELMESRYKYEIDISHLPIGVYTLIMSSTSFYTSRKIVKQ